MLSNFRVIYIIRIFSFNRLCRDTERNKEIGFLEAQVYEYVEILGVSQSGARSTCRTRRVGKIFNDVFFVLLVVTGAETADT